MMQREVADRWLRARAAARLRAALCHHANQCPRGDGYLRFRRRRSPAPEVFSTVLRLEFAPRFSELGVDAAGFDAFLRRCFAQKRKTLADNLRAAGPSGARGYTAGELRAAWPAAIPPLARAESLALEPLAALYFHKRLDHRNGQSKAVFRQDRKLPRVVTPSGESANDRQSFVSSLADITHRLQSRFRKENATQRRLPQYSLFHWR